MKVFDFNQASLCISVTVSRAWYYELGERDRRHIGSKGTGLLTSIWVDCATLQSCFISSNAHASPMGHIRALRNFWNKHKWLSVTERYGFWYGVQRRDAERRRHSEGKLHQTLDLLDIWGHSTRTEVPVEIIILRNISALKGKGQEQVTRASQEAFLVLSALLLL